jgi:hypothetical protein
LKKRTKKLLRLEVCRWKGARQHNKSFLLLFFKKEALAFLRGMAAPRNPSLTNTGAVITFRAAIHSKEA